MDRNWGILRRLIIWTLLTSTTTFSIVYSEELQAVSNISVAAPEATNFNNSTTALKKEPAIIVVAENPGNLNSWTPTAPNSTTWNPSRTFFSRSTSWEDPLPPNPHYSKSDQLKLVNKRAKTPTGPENKSWRMEDVRSRVMDYGKMFFSQFMGHGGGDAEYGERHEEAPKAGRGLVNWLSRLIGVDGKSLGEFLREYQVHVLYDLVFTFFKWIFFLYAGLLIP